MTLRSWREWVASCLLLATVACADSRPSVIASHCESPEQCAQTQALHLDAVDILFVIDNSNSIVAQASALKAQLPRMLTAITTGSDAAMNFPPVNSVHVAVTTTEMSIGNDEFMGCPGTDSTAQDGVFVRPGQVGVTCDLSYPGYLAYEGGPAAVATVDNTACVPLVFAEPYDPESPDAFTSGCGFEQPLEAALKSVWPSEDGSVTFLNGESHGTRENAGFLRENSLLVVVIVTDEDDCSAQDLALFSRDEAGTADLGPINLRCMNHKDDLYPVERYVSKLKGLRPHNDNVVFAAIAGVPTELVSEDYRANYDVTAAQGVSDYYQSVLDSDLMQEVAENPTEDTAWLQPSCIVTVDDPANPSGQNVDRANPPRRLVEVARGFGPNGVLGSICASDFGETTGRIIHAIGERLLAAH